MNRAVNSNNQFATLTGIQEQQPLVMSFLPDPSEEQSGCQIDLLWQLEKRTLEQMALDLSTPKVLLERLAAHPLAEIRAAVSDNINTPLYTIWLLARDLDADVRYQIAENHRFPEALIGSLIDDENPYVAGRAQKTLARLRAS